MNSYKTFVALVGLPVVASLAACAPTATEENFGVIHMFTGDSAPQPPLPGSGPYGPGCVVGSHQFKR